jgi:hypothetical protein
MNETLSTLIAFIGFLIIFSMLVKSVQEALKNILKLKAGVWERFFLGMYKREFSSAITEPADLPLEPFWKTIGKREFIGEFDKRLKRLNTMVAKADTVIKALKKELCEVVAIENPVAEKAAFSSNISDMADELKEVIGLKLDVLLKTYDRITGFKIRDFCGNIESFERAFSEFQTQQELSDEFAVQLHEKCSQLLKMINEIERKISDYRVQLENKADTWLAQINEEYKRNMLKWTVIIGFAFVVFFNADAFTIYSALHSDPGARAALVEKAMAITEKTHQAGTGENLNALEAALRKGETEEAKTLIVSLSERLQKDFQRYKASDKADAAKKIGEDAAKMGMEAENVTVALKKQYGDLTSLYLELQKQSVDHHLDQLQDMKSANLPLGWSEDWKALKAATGAEFMMRVFSKIGGLLLTTFLITFGAPFWNDVLKAVVGVREVASKKH